MNEDLLYQIAITQVPKIGTFMGKKLIAKFGSAKAAFMEKDSILHNIYGLNNDIICGLKPKDPLLIAEKEINYAENNAIRIISYLDDNYPERLKHCPDCPIVLFVKGNSLPKKKNILAIVGTRHASDYGKHICEQIISELINYDVGIVSGLAYGIDTCAHLSALNNNLPTYAVLGHGFEIIYPFVNAELAINIENSGCLISEFISTTQPDRENFPQRNRIIAGLSDAVLVVESAAKGGSLITAEYASSYYREVFAIPGRISDTYSSGCNNLIKKQKACITLSAKDIIENMNWDIDANKSIQKKLFYDLNEIQEKIYNILKNKGNCNIDTMSIMLEIPINYLSCELLDMELNGIIRCLPGKVYEIY